MTTRNNQSFDAMRSQVAAILQTVIDEQIAATDTTSRSGSTREAARRAAKQLSPIDHADAYLVVAQQEFDRIDRRESDAASGQLDFSGSPTGWFKDGEGGRKPKRLALLADWVRQRRLTGDNRRSVDDADDREQEEFLLLVPLLSTGMNTDDAYAVLRT